MKAVLNSYPPSTPTGLGTLCRSLLKALPFEGFLWHPHRLAKSCYFMEEMTKDWNSLGCWVSPDVRSVESQFPGTWLVAIERPLPADLFCRAKAAGMRTALIVMHEWFNRDCAWLKDTDLFICPNEIAYQKVADNYGLGNDVSSRIVKCRLPLDLDSLPFRERTKVDRFVFSNGWGGVHDRKGWPEMSKAIDFLPFDLPYKVKVCSQRKLLGNNISVPTTADIYADADCAVVPSRFEGLGLAILEPMAMGLPVLATDAEPISEYLREAYGDLAWACLNPPKSIQEVSIWGHPVVSTIADPWQFAETMRRWTTGYCGSGEKDFVRILSNRGRRWIEEQWGASAAKQLEELLS